MVEYADFYVLIATLSPIFLTGSLLAHYRLAKAERTKSARRYAWLALGVNILLTFIIMVVALTVLGGFWVQVPASRYGAISGLLMQLFVSLLLALLEASRSDSASNGAQPPGTTPSQPGT